MLTSTRGSPWVWRSKPVTQYWEVEAGGLEAYALPQLYSELEPSLGYKRPCHKQMNKQTEKKKGKKKGRRKKDFIEVFGGK